MKFCLVPFISPSPLFCCVGGLVLLRCCVVLGCVGVWWCLGSGLGGGLLSFVSLPPCSCPLLLLYAALGQVCAMPAFHSNTIGNMLLSWRKEVMLLKALS